jgi:vancomycin permeability regulator SanA
MEVRRAQRIVNLEKRMLIAQEYHKKHGVFIGDHNVLGLSESELLLKLHRALMKK